LQVYSAPTVLFFPLVFASFSAASFAHEQRSVGNMGPKLDSLLCNDFCATFSAMIFALRMDMRAVDCRQPTLANELAAAMIMLVTKF
jgi:hypothetical protein